MTGQYDLKFETIFEAMSNKIVYYILNNEIRRQSGRIGKMTSGKTVAQVSHASVRMFQSGVSTTEWQENGLASKIFNGSPAVIDKIISCAKTRRINYVTVHDAGRTQIVFGSLTVLAIGPEIEYILNPLIQDLSEVL